MIPKIKNKWIEESSSLRSQKWLSGQSAPLASMTPWIWSLVPPTCTEPGPCTSVLWEVAPPTATSLISVMSTARWLQVRPQKKSTWSHFAPQWTNMTLGEKHPWKAPQRQAVCGSGEGGNVRGKKSLLWYVPGWLCITAWLNCGDSQMASHLS